MIKEESGVYKFDSKPVQDIFCNYDHSLRTNNVPIVVDYGSSVCRMGWASQKSPKLQFRNAIAKSRKDSEILVGNSIDSIEVRQTLKTPFDKNVITHFEAFETVFDYGLSRLGLNDEENLNHSVCITECLANPTSARNNLNEVLFELYGTPSISYGIDSLFSLLHDHNDIEDSLVINLGHQSIHVIPVLAGKPHLHKARRINLGGAQLLTYMQKILQLRYPSQSSNITLSRVEDMFTLTRVSSDFFKQLKEWKDPQFYEKNEVRIQFPFVPVSRPPPADPEVLKARRQELGRRLIEINARKREAKLKENQALLNQLLMVQGLKNQEAKFRRALEKLSLKNTAELEAQIYKTRNWIQKAEEAKQRDANRDTSEPESKKKREEMDDSEKLEFDVWIQDIKNKLENIRERKASRAARRKQLAKRRTAASQQRMRIINQLARNNKEDDTFGMNDSDWEIYKQISRDAEESDSEEETLKLQEYESVLKEHANSDDQMNKNCPEWHRIPLSTELIMVPEIIFQPSIIGLEQAGLSETIEFIFTKYSDEEVGKLANNIVLTGALAKISGLKERLEVELQQMLPFQSTFNVRLSEDPTLGAWKGASLWASNPDNQRSGFMSKEEYLENGAGFLKPHFAANVYSPIPFQPDDKE